MANLQRLTKRMIVDAKPVAGRVTFMWDGELRGFGCKIESAGTKSFVLQYRNAERRKRRIVLGRFGVMTIEQARDEARIKLGEIARGIDPADERQCAKNSVTVGEMCDWYLTEAEAGLDAIACHSVRTLTPPYLRPLTTLNGIPTGAAELAQGCTHGKLPASSSATMRLVIVS